MVYQVEVKKPSSKGGPPIIYPAAVVGVLDKEDKEKVRIWARGPMLNNHGLDNPSLKFEQADEEEMWILSAYGRAKDFLNDKATMATYSGSWVVSLEDVEITGTIGLGSRTLPAGTAGTAATELVMSLPGVREWLAKPAITPIKRAREEEQEEEEEEKGAKCFCGTLCDDADIICPVLHCHARICKDHPMPKCQCAIYCDEHQEHKYHKINE